MLNSETSSGMPRRASLGRLVNQSTMLLMVSIGALILLLALLILVHENANATKGYSLRRLENQRSLLLLDQEVLNMQIAEAQSLDTLENDPQIASMQGTTKGAKYVKPESAVAIRRVVSPEQDKLWPWD